MDPDQTSGSSAAADGPVGAAAIERGSRAVTYPYKRIARPQPSPVDGPDPYGNPDPEWLGIDWSQYQRWIELDGARVNYVEIGEGPPIVFVHGLGGCWQNWLENLPPFRGRRLSRDRDRPARLRLQPDAYLGDQHSRLWTPGR